MAPDLGYIRTLYLQAPFDESKAMTLISVLGEQEIPTTTLEGYRGAALMVMAKHAHNPYSKLRYFNNGKGVLENAIARDRNNTELHFLRYTVQTNVPAFLGYNQHLEEDAQFLQKHLPSLPDKQLKDMISSFLDHRQHN